MEMLAIENNVGYVVNKEDFDIIRQSKMSDELKEELKRNAKIFAENNLG